MVALNAITHPRPAACDEERVAVAREGGEELLKRVLGSASLRT